MCPPGCLHSVCQQATRRGLLKTGFTLGLGAVAAATMPAVGPARAATSFTDTVDLSHALYEGFPTFSGEKWFTVEQLVTFAKDKVNLNRWTIVEHSGTHMDAPIHFSADGMTADLIPIADLIVPVAVINIAAPRRRQSRHVAHAGRHQGLGSQERTASRRLLRRHEFRLAQARWRSEIHRPGQREEEPYAGLPHRGGADADWRTQRQRHRCRHVVARHGPQFRRRVSGPLCMAGQWPLGASNASQTSTPSPKTEPGCFWACRR